jgi:hypothetical protein
MRKFTQNKHQLSHILEKVLGIHPQVFINAFLQTMSGKNNLSNPGQCIGVPLEQDHHRGIHLRRYTPSRHLIKDKLRILKIHYDLKIIHQNLTSITVHNRNS